MVLAIVALGANLKGRFSSPGEAIEVAFGEIERHAGVVTGRSRLYRSQAWPDPADPEFTNAVLAVGTSLSAEALLGRLHDIEADFGRVRHDINAPRPLDLDVVDYGGMVSAPGENPILPHPRMTERAFVLLPLQEIAPDWRHPATGKKIAELIAALSNPDSAYPL